MSAEALHGPDGPHGELWFWERVIMPELLGVGALEPIVVLRISRLDVHVDIAGTEFTLADLDNFISRATDDDTKRHNRKVTGFLFGRRGKGATVARIYNKLWDIECKPEGGYLLDLYGELGLQADESVWRVEFEFHNRPAPRTRNRHGLRSHRPSTGLLRYGVEDWLWLSVPDTATRRERRNIDPRWALVQAAIIGNGAEASHKITKQRHSAPKELQLVQSGRRLRRHLRRTHRRADLRAALRRWIIRLSTKPNNAGSTSTPPSAKRPATTPHSLPGLLEDPPPIP